MAAGIDRTTHYRWLEDPDYAEQFALAQQDAGESLEAEARRRAVEGWQEPIFYQGQLVGHRPRHSDVLLIFLLKGAMPEKYGDKLQQTHQGQPSGPIQVVEVDDWYGTPLGAATQGYGSQESA